MVFDLKSALLKKQEVETARLLDFEFRVRAKTMKLLAARRNVSSDMLIGRIVTGDDATVLAALATEWVMPEADLLALHQECRAAARKQLVEEIGDPAPHRLA